jgi:threonine dehydratase
MMPSNIKPPSMPMIFDAAQRLKGTVPRIPLVPLVGPEVPSNVYLKLENLSPIGSFKWRTAGYPILKADKNLLADGVYTVSAGNLSQGVAWWARKLGLKAKVFIWENAPQLKIEAARRLGASIEILSEQDAWHAFTHHKIDGMEGLYVDPISQAVMAGEATMGLEILEELPDVDTILVPFGSGGMCCSIAAAVKAFKPNVKIIGCESAHAAPFKAALSAGHPVEIDMKPSFVDGIGSRSVVPEMWPMLQELVNGSCVVSVDEIGSAIKLLLLHNRVLAEGAAAASVAAALSNDQNISGNVVCLITGSHLPVEILQSLLNND